MSNPRVSIIIPSYNESQEVKSNALKSVDEYLKKQNYSYEVLIVDDESTNDTLSTVEKEIKNFKNFRLLKNKHGGKAITVMTGLIESRGEIALFTDMDQATPINEVEEIILKFEEGFDIVIGSRQGRKGAPLIRKLAAFIFALLRNIVLGLPFKDTQCGFKAFNRKAVENVFPEMLERWQKIKTNKAAVNAGFDIETLFLAKKKGFKITEVGVQWHHVGTEQVQIVRDSLEAVRDILRIRLNDITGKYD